MAGRWGVKSKTDSVIQFPAASFPLKSLQCLQCLPDRCQLSAHDNLVGTSGLGLKLQAFEEGFKFLQLLIFLQQSVELVIITSSFSLQLRDSALDIEGSLFEEGELGRLSHSRKEMAKSRK